MARKDKSPLDLLLERAGRDPRFLRWLEALQAARGRKGRHANLIGPGPGQKAYLLAAADYALEGKTSWTVVVPDELHLRRWEELLRPLYPDLLIFRPRDLDLIGVEAGSRSQEHSQLAVMSQILQNTQEGRPSHCLLSATALLQRLPPPSTFLRKSLRLHDKLQMDPLDLERDLLRLGYERVAAAETVGQFSRRGDILDIVPVGGDGHEGLRLSFFDTELDGFQRFSTDTQRSTGRVEGDVLLPPVRVLFVEEGAALARRLRNKGEATLLELRREGADREALARLERQLEKEALAFEEGLRLAPLDKWAGEILPGASSFLDYLPHDLPLFLDEPTRLRQALDAHQAEWCRKVSHGLLQGYCLPLAEKAQFSRAEIMRQLDQDFSLHALATIGISGNGRVDAENFEIHGRETESYRGRDQILLQELKQGGAPFTFLCAADENRRKKLQLALEEAEIGLHRYRLLPLPLPRGFEYPAADLRVLGEEEIFAGPAKRRRHRKGAGLSLDLFSDLRPGDRVVHEVHGIGIYEGLENVETGGVRRDYLRLSYAKGDSLFLPMEALDQLQKYIGGSEQNPPKLSRLGGSDWERLKTKARETIKTLATDLVRLYATRSRLKGHAFPPTTAWEEDFADRFPYEETEDQLRSIREINRDMEAPRVMDRLLCGDVGFGKTEVAFRAIFKAVMGGKQAALLVPTTVLAHQHYENLRERLGDFPVRVAVLSRFVQPTVQREILRQVKKGEIDVLIGTHRLLSQDVHFHDLGLLVVDEEQRFGVDHKEVVKERYPQVDVLTLSATPIPRTLHMSLSGIRDISVLEEAPLDRRPVMTYVLEYDTAVIQDAILRELSRSGQVFYLFNNTHKIHEKAAELETLLPGARIGIAHGKMSEKQLEPLMEAFAAREIDVLVCTTLIESGIDLPNVNTLIVEHADRLGLAQLYQLRGRVGRSGRQAYAYVTYRRDHILTEVAEQRLAAIRDFTELGAGFKIAMKDLEVRGAGNLLGGEQHGQMEAIGYDLYCRMLEEEVRQLRAGEEGEEAPLAYVEPDTVVELRVDAYLSPDFIPDEGQRMDMYRRLVRLSTSEEYFDVLDELTDRYGNLPEEVQLLADISLIRHQAAKHSIDRIFRQGRDILLRLADHGRLNMEALSALMAQEEYSGQLLFHAGAKPHILYRSATDDDRSATKKLLRLFLAAEAEASQ